MVAWDQGCGVSPVMPGYWSDCSSLHGHWWPLGEKDLKANGP